MSMKKRMDDLREESGAVTYSDPLTSFLYQLMRDHLPAGKVEELVWHVSQEPADGCIFTNGWLAKYANNLAETLKGMNQIKLKRDLKNAFDEAEFAKKILAQAAELSPPAEEIEDEALADLKSQLDEIPDGGKEVKDVVEHIKDSLSGLVDAGMMAKEEAEKLNEELKEFEVDPVETDVQEKDCDGDCGDDCCKKTNEECCEGDQDGRTPKS